MPPPSDPAVTRVDVSLRPDELVSAWRAESRRLVLPAREAPRLQQRIAARVTIAGLGVAATITGRVTSSSRDASFHRIELVPDETRVRAVERLVAVARGEAAGYEKRAPRLLASVPAVVHGPVGPRYMNTFSVSERGCGLTWSGPAPAVGARMEVRLGAGSRAASFRGAVCWTALAGRTTTVGLFFLAGAKDAWTSMLAELQRSGAPPA